MLWTRQGQQKVHGALTEVLTAFREMDAGQNIAVAVRSSATAEDLPEASFAGQQETFLNVVGIDNVLDAMKHVFASLYNDRAISYRVHHKFEHETVALSAAGIETYSHKQGDQLFGASDNLPLAVKGVPAHTLFVAGEYPEYHRPGDTADKLNYPNFAKVTNGIVAAVLALGSNMEEAQWNEGSPAAARFAAAYRELHKRP